MKSCSFILLTAMALCIPLPTHGQEALTVQSPRPLSEALTTLERKYGLHIFYEDPAFTDPRDLVDKTSLAYRGPHRAIEPREGRIDIRYFISPVTGKPESTDSLLQMLVDDHARHNNPGQFQVRVIDNLYFITPVGGSVLDTNITLPAKQRTYNQALQEIADAVGSATRIPVRIAEQLGQRTLMPITFSANNEPARNVLLKVFQMQKDFELWWQLLYAPSWGFFLNVHAERKPSQVPPASPIQTTKQDKNPDGSHKNPVPH